MTEENPGPKLASTSPPGLATSRPSYLRALRSRSFLWLWTSQLISQSGDFVFEIALIWLVLQTTGSILEVSLVVVVTLLPVVLLGPVLGVYTDRWPRRTILILTNLVEGALVAALAGAVLAHTETFPLILAIAFALGVGGQFTRITSDAMVPQTVGVQDLAPANSLVSLSGSSSQVAGLAIGGIVVALLGTALPITYDVGTFVAAAIIISLIPSGVGRPERSGPGATERFSGQFKEGLKYVLAQRFLLELVAIGVVVNFCGNAAFALWAPYSDRVLHGGASGYGLLGAGLALGAIIGTLVVGRIETRKSTGVFVLGGNLGVGVVLIALGLTRYFPLAFAEALLFGGTLSIINIPLISLIQAKVPAHLMGRATSVLLSLNLAAGPLGAVFAGVLASATSISLVYVLAGGIVLVMDAVAIAGMREVRTLSY